MCQNSTNFLYFLENEHLKNYSSQSPNEKIREPKYQNRKIRIGKYIIKIQEKCINRYTKKIRLRRGLCMVLAGVLCGLLNIHIFLADQII